MEFALSDKKFEGVLFKKREVASFSLLELSYSPGIEIPMHAHEQANFCMPIEGGCAEIYGRKVREFTPFSLNFLPPQQAHSFKASNGGMRAFSIDIAPPWLERMREYSLKVEDSVYCSSGILVQLQMRLYHEFQNMDDASPLAVEGIALEMLAEASRHQVINKDGGGKVPYWLKQARAIVHEEFSLHLSLDAIAQAVEVHPVHLARMFRKYYRCTIGEYVRRVRIENACRQLMTTETPLTEIALACGFSDQSHFNRIFKHQKGMTPSEYRAEFASR
ncbi:MAG TPA: AraC family transcriptional regulator [Pyrinomonadaceae bacterium]